MSGFTPWPDQELDNPLLADVSDGARLLYYSILARVSHRGRLPGTPRGLARELRLNHVAVVSRYLNELLRQRVVEAVDGTLDGAPMRVLQVVDYAEIEALPDNRRYASKLPVSERFPLDQDDPQGRECAEIPQQEGRKEEDNEKREEKKSSHTARARTKGSPGSRSRRSKTAPLEQLHLAKPIEAPIECPEPIREVVEAWEQHAERLRAAGVPVPAVARRDILALAVDVAPEVFTSAVQRHLKSKPSYWLSPLVCLSMRVRWAVADLVYVEPPEVATRFSPSSVEADENPAAAAAAARVSWFAKQEAARAARFAEQKATYPVAHELEGEPWDSWRADWSQAVDALRGIIEPWDWLSWIAPCRAMGRLADDGAPVFVVAAPDASHAAWVATHFAPMIEQALGYQPALGTYDFGLVSAPDGADADVPY